MKAFIRVALLSLCVALVACSTMNHTTTTAMTNDQEVPLGTGTVAGVQIGGAIGRSMNEMDRVKLTRALDKSPGTPTTWMNASNGTSYTVTPIRKLAVNGNPLCRQYQVVAVRGGNSQQVNGTACVASDGAWSEVSG